MQTTTYDKSVLSTIQAAHLDAAIAVLRHLDDEVGPRAYGILSAWISLNGELSTEALGQAEPLIGSIRGALQEASSLVRLSDTPESPTDVQDILTIEGLASEWLNRTQRSNGLLAHQAGWQGVSVLYQGQQRVRELIARLTRQVTEGSIVRTAPAPQDRVKYSPDFSSLTIDDTSIYTFKARQRGPVRLLVEAIINGTPALSHALLLEASGGDADRLRDVFKESKNRLHPAWGTLIVKCSGASDLYQLRLPPFNSHAIPKPVPA